MNIVMLGYDELLTIYKYISLHFTASQIARKMNIAPSTLYRVVKSNLQIKKRNTYSLQFHFRDCKFVPECKKTLSRCPTECPKYRQYLCEKITRFPFFSRFLRFADLLYKRTSLLESSPRLPTSPGAPKRN
ncbi:MAG: hypothetical protein MZU97_23080 [Bacillus subtilis]|nr:hypothetical protein [Bacillus subtilis]